MGCGRRSGCGRRQVVGEIGKSAGCVCGVHANGEGRCVPGLGSGSGTVPVPPCMAKHVPWDGMAHGRSLMRQREGHCFIWVIGSGVDRRHVAKPHMPPSPPSPLGSFLVREVNWRWLIRGRQGKVLGNKMIALCLVDNSGLDCLEVTVVASLSYRASL